MKTLDGIMSFHSFSFNQTSNTAHYRFVSCNCHQCNAGNKSNWACKYIAGLEYEHILKKPPPPKQTQQLKNKPQPGKPRPTRSVPLQQTAPPQQRKHRQKAIKRGTKRKH